MEATRNTTVALKPSRTTAVDAVTDAILARGRAVLEAEAAAIGDACGRVSGGLRYAAHELRSARPTGRSIIDSHSGWYMNWGQLKIIGFSRSQMAGA